LEDEKNFDFEEEEEQEMVFKKNEHEILDMSVNYTVNINKNF